jgi:hypothetical protein
MGAGLVPCPPSRKSVGMILYEQCFVGRLDCDITRVGSDAENLVRKSFFIPRWKSGAQFQWSRLSSYYGVKVEISWPQIHWAIFSVVTSFAQDKHYKDHDQHDALRDSKDQSDMGWGFGHGPILAGKASRGIFF